MSIGTFLENHEQALGSALGIKIVEMEKLRVVAFLETRAQHLTEAGAVQGGVIMAIADVAGALGAVLNLPDGYVTATLESKTNFLRRGSGTRLWAESVPVHVGRTTSVWRSMIWRGTDLSDRERVAEVTQTQINLKAKQTVGQLPPGQMQLP